MTPDVTAVIVNHRSAEESAACAASLRACYAHENLRGEIVLVDCASGGDERRRLEAVPADVRVFLDENRGYSGGANAGLARARAARLLVCNADVVFSPGAVTTLLGALADDRVGAAAPLCHWDAAGRVRLPADSATSLWGELAERSAGRFAGLDRRRFSVFARRTLRLWEQGGDARHLVGAVLAARRDVFDRVGRFDERFLFEYEETEWEERVRRSGLRLRFEPRARVRHLYARSAARSPEAAERRAASRRRYWERRYGRLARRILERPAWPRPTAATETPEAPEPLVRARSGATLAISTNPSLIPFAGVALTDDFLLPPEIVASLPSGPLHLRVFRDADGAPLETRVWRKP